MTNLQYEGNLNYSDRDLDFFFLLCEVLSLPLDFIPHISVKINDNNKIILITQRAIQPLGSYLQKPFSGQLKGKSIRCAF